MLNLSSGKVLTPQCVLWLAAQMKVFQSLSLVMEFFFNTNLVFTMCYLIPPNHIFTSLHFILFHPILFQPIPFYLLLFHLNPCFPIHFYSSSSHFFSHSISFFCLYISLSISYQSSLILSPSFPSHPISFNHLPCSLYAYHPVLFCSISFLSTHPIPSYILPCIRSPLIFSHPVSCSLPSHSSHTHPLYLTQSCYFCSHPVSSHPIVLHFLLPIHFFLSYLLFSRPIFFPKSIPDPVSLHSHLY